MLEIIMRFMFLGHHQKRGFSLSRMFEALLVLVLFFLLLCFESNNKAEDDRQGEEKQKNKGDWRPHLSAELPWVEQN